MNTTLNIGDTIIEYHPRAIDITDKYRIVGKVVEVYNDGIKDVVKVSYEPIKDKYENPILIDISRNNNDNTFMYKFKRKLPKHYPKIVMLKLLTEDIKELINKH